MKTDIWSERIQELILSGIKENIVLAFSLIEDKRLLIYWSWLDRKTSEEFNLPYLELGIAHAFVKMNAGNVSTVDNPIEYIKQAYDRCVE